MNGAPLAKDDLQYFTAVDTALVVGSGDHPLMENDWDPEGSSLTASIVTNPANGTLSNFSSSAGTFTYTPNTAFSGVETFTYRVSDGSSDSNVVSVAIAVGGDFGARTNGEEMPMILGETPLTAALPSGCSANSSPIRYEASCLTGDLHLAQMLTPGVSLVYNSGTLPKPIIVVESFLQSTSNVPDEVKAQLLHRPRLGRQSQ